MASKEIITRGFGFSAKFLPTRGYLFAPTLVGIWAHPVASRSANSVRINANSGRVQANADLPRILLDGDTDIDPPADNERIEVEG